MPAVCLALCKVSKGIEKQGHMPAKDNFKLEERSPLHYCTILGLLDTNYMPGCAGHHGHTITIMTVR